MGPPFGKAEKTQILSRFDNHGMYILSKTWIKDVPMTDCFYVEDCLLVSSNTDGGVSVSIKFDLTFVRRTMFRKVITMTSVSELSRFHKGYVDFIEDILSKSENKGDLQHMAINDNRTIIINDTADQMTNNDCEPQTDTNNVDTISSRKLYLKIVKEQFCTIFTYVYSKIPKLDPSLLVILICVVFNQILISSQLAKAQEKISILETIIDGTKCLYK